MTWIEDWLCAHPAPPAQARPRGIDISYSQIRAYLDCPWQYRLRYVSFLRARLTAPAALGLSIHHALEAFHREAGSRWERLLECYDENWVHSGFTTAPEQMEWYRKGEAILKTYFDGEAARRSEIVAVEREFLLPLGAHTLHGTIDRIDRRPDGDHEVIDYKTHLDIQTEAQAADDLQLGIYGLGADESLAIDPRWLTLYYVAADRRVSVPYDPDRNELIEALIMRVADLAARGRAFAPDTSFCARCGFRERCAHSVAKEEPGG
ncbi:MAG: PD-(D/E)XK nuclease family protein [Elusimicrobiota bacterium]